MGEVWMAYLQTARNMYTNLEFTEILSAVKTTLPNLDPNQYSINLPPKEIIIDLLQIILENNEFTFDGKIYKQILGVPMGGSASAELADLRMYQIFESILSKYKFKSSILTCLRYRDDGFILHSGTAEQIQNLFQIANKSHKHLKFTFEFSNQEITFLDTHIYKGKRFKEEGILDIKTYTKKTETFQYLDRTSAHPTSVFKGFLKAEVIRNIRNTSDIQELKLLIDLFKSRLLNRNYKEDEIDLIIKSTLQMDRKLLLKNSKKHAYKPLVLITKYNPAVKQLKQKLVKHWKFITNDEECANLFTSPPMIAYKRHRNLMEILKQN